MQIRKRLKTIASLVDKGSNVIDIGCDHALLDIYLTLYNSNTCIASDINENAYNIAKSNIKKYNLTDKIQVIKSDGFKKIKMTDTYTAIICGMGTTTILEILKSPKINMVDTIIIQSNNDIYKIRKIVSKLGYYIDNEIIVKEKGLFYTIIKFKKGKKYYSYKKLQLGPIIINNQTQEKKEYFEFLINSNNDILKKMPKKYYFKRLKLKYMNTLYKKEL